MIKRRSESNIIVGSPQLLQKSDASPPILSPRGFVVFDETFTRATIPIIYCLPGQALISGNAYRLLDSCRCLLNLKRVCLAADLEVMEKLNPYSRSAAGHTQMFEIETGIKYVVNPLRLPPTFASNTLDLMTSRCRSRMP